MRILHNIHSNYKKYAFSDEIPGTRLLDGRLALSAFARIFVSIHDRCIPFHTKTVNDLHLAKAETFPMIIRTQSSEEQLNEHAEANLDTESFLLPS